MMFISRTMSIFDIVSYCSILLCIVTYSKTCTILVTVLMVDIGHETAAGRTGAWPGCAWLPLQVLAEKMLSASTWIKIH